ncbi:serum paraoxonase arylesterase [Pyrrhoderma noxium]|uniref:Serum paraoxonase arylesterase n=1 Tax=Pyrrhoderma noxium TaxID=2282107 RepID=A0A286UH16_9AGAM|nr:serum paraoxonase arylesterase [Pyrrhoderma noxium]
MSRLVLTVLVGLVAVVTGFYQLVIRPKLVVLGEGRIIQPIGNTKCVTYPESKACEKILLHEPSGLLYMACSTQESRVHWLPTSDRLNATGKSSVDYVSVFDPSSGKVTRLTTEGFKFPRGLSFHGMDIAPSTDPSRPHDIFLYLVNHRAPLGDADAAVVGADSVIEVFKTRPGGEDIHYVATFKDPVISTPNDIAATGEEDKGFYFTNDHGMIKTGWARRHHVDTLLGWAVTNVGYCNVVDGCKIVAEGLVGVNGIAKGKDGKYYVASSTSGRVYVFDRQADNSLVLEDEISTDRPIDNLSIDKDGSVWGAAFVHAMELVNVHFANPSINTASSALRITPNDGAGSYFGEKYKIERVFEDDGTLASGTTSVAYDVKRKKLYLHGIASPQLTVCDIEV